MTMRGKKRATGGGVDVAEKDFKDKPMSYTAKDNVTKAAEERKRGGRTMRKSGGKMVDCEGEKAKMHAGRKPRKSGGACEREPFTTAKSGSERPGGKVADEMGEW
jgi:hypothetical protein